MKPKTRGELGLKLKPKSTFDKNGCDDHASNCQKFVPFCTELAYMKVLQTYCKFSCGHCAPSKDKCLDISTSCPKLLEEDLCASPYISEQIKLMKCAKSCDLCEKNIDQE